MRRLPLRRGLRSEADRGVLGGFKIGGGVLIAGENAPIRVLGERVEHVVAPLDDLDVGRIVGHTELAVGLLLGVAHQVVVRRRLRNGGQQRDLAEGQLVEIGDVLDAEIAARGGHDAVAAIAVVVLVEVGGHDALLAIDAWVRIGHAHRLDDFLDLALDRSVGVAHQIWVEQALAYQLLCDGRGATGIAAQRVDDRGEHAHRVEAGIRPERLVFDRGDRVDQDRRDLVVGDDLPALAARETRQLDGARSVVDDRLLDRDVRL